MALRSALVIFALAVAPGLLRADDGPGDYTFALIHDGYERTYLLHVPSLYSVVSPMPLVLDLHGASRSGSLQRQLSRLDDVADVRGFLVAYPESDPGGWDVDDVEFCLSVVTDVSQRFSVIRERIYATGYSAGGALAHQLACDAAEVFAAVAPTAFPVPYPDSCQPSRSISVIHLHGLYDESVPYEGGEAPGGFVILAAWESFAFWAALNRCVGEPEVTFIQGESICETCDTCARSVEVTLCSIDSGHAVYLPHIPELIWDRLSRYTLSRPMPEPRRPTRRIVPSRSMD